MLPAGIQMEMCALDAFASTFNHRLCVEGRIRRFEPMMYEPYVNTPILKISHKILDQMLQ